jgi:integrase
VNAGISALLPCELTNRVSCLLGARLCPLGAKLVKDVKWNPHIHNLGPLLQSGNQIVKIPVSQKAMQHETELDVIEPSSRDTLGPLYQEPNAESTGSKLERNITATSSDGMKRGKWQVAAILIALYVRFHALRHQHCATFSLQQSINRTSILYETPSFTRLTNRASSPCSLRPWTQLS